MKEEDILSEWYTSKWDKMVEELKDSRKKVMKILTNT